MHEPDLIEIEYDSVPPEIANVLDPMLRRYGPFVYKFVDTFTVHLLIQEEDDGTEAAISIARRYRTASVFVTARFLQLSDERREATVAHEMAHIFTAPLRQEFMTLLEVSEAPEIFKDYALGVYTEADELVTTDLSRLLLDVVWDRS